MLRRCRPLLGTFVEVVGNCNDAIDAAFAAVARVHRLMSAHEPDSDVSRINRFAHIAPVAVDGWTAAVLQRSTFWSEQSEGAFDVVRAGKSAIRRGALPLRPGQPNPEAEDSGCLELEGSCVGLRHPGAIDLGGIGKGFAVDRAIAALRLAGSDYGFVNAGGDLSGYGKMWSAEIVEPRRRRSVAEVAITNNSLATSSLIDGRFDHLPDANSRWILASVRASSAMDADALTKVLLSGSAAAEHCLAAAGADGLRMLTDGTLERLDCVPA